MSLMGIDIGTTGSKAVVFDINGNVLAQAYREYPLSTPKPGWAELDPNFVWKCLKEIISDVNSKVAKDPVEAVSASSMSESFTPIGKNGEFLSKSIANIDTRAFEFKKFWEGRYGRLQLFKITGQPYHIIFSINKYMWIKKHRPDIYKKTWKFLNYEDFLYFMLGGCTSISESVAARTMAMDINTRKWSDFMFKAAKIDIKKMPDIKPAGTVVGELKTSIMKELGFKKRAKIVVGAHDQIAASTGAGIVKEGMSVNSIGTVDCITPAFSKVLTNEKMLSGNYCVSPHTIKGLYSAFAYNFTAGSLLKWYRDTFSADEKAQAKKSGKDVYSIIFNDLPVKPTNIFILPHFTVTGTPHFESNPKGAIIGLSLNTTKAEIKKAILEGVSYEIKHNIYLLEKSGVKVNVIRAMGGGSKSDIWLQLKADMYNKQIVTTNVTEAGCLGVAILGGVALGKYKSIQEASSKIVKVKKSFYPRKEQNKIYEEKFETYKKIYPAVKTIYN